MQYCVKLNLLCFSLQELIQNADDAGAETVTFFLDERSHNDKHLFHPALGQFQKPALVVHNDKEFTPEDWENIQTPRKSHKMVDVNKIGTSGSGFCSVFHITGMYIIANK